jgi:membrane-associated phospholipid phosphatase
MRGFLQIISYVLHPIFVPIAGTVIYFQVTPKYTSNEFESGNVLPIFILTVIIPIIAFLILKNLGLVKSAMMPTLKERRYPMYIGILLLLLVVYKVLPNNFTFELHYFFLGLISGTAASLALLYLNFKSSMHLMGMGSLVMYIICLSVHFEINITLALSFMILLTGLAASSRIFLKVHSKVELLIGFSIGVISQLLTVKFWL